MFSLICPRVYQKLRERKGLTQSELGKRIGGNRHTIRHFESGKTRPDAAQESRLLEATDCSRLEFAQLVCEELGKLIETPVGVLTHPGAYEPTTLLSRANSLLRQANGRLPAAKARRINRGVTRIQMMSLVFDYDNAELEELLQSCRQDLEEGMGGMQGPGSE